MQILNLQPNCSDNFLPDERCKSDGKAIEEPWLVNYHILDSLLSQLQSHDLPATVGHRRMAGSYLSSPKFRDRGKLCVGPNGQTGTVLSDGGTDLLLRVQG